MSKHVSKYCSILNYIRSVNEQLYTLIEELCLGRIFVPRRGTDGITFLMPSKDMIEKFYELDREGETEKVAEHVRTLVLRHHITDVSEFKISGNEVISTISKKALPIKSVSGNTVLLEGGQKIVIDPKFTVRGDRSNKLSVFHISGDLIDLSSLKSVPDGARAPVKGGGDYTGGRKKLFERVLDVYCNSAQDRDPALEVLVSLLNFLASSDGDVNILELVQSQLSKDTLTTLAIVLQPYKRSDYYIPEALFNAWSTKYNVPGAPDLFSYIRSPVASYNSAMSAAASKYKLVVNELKQIQTSIDLTTVSKAEVASKMVDFFQKAKSLGLPASRLSTLNNSKQAIAEAELRVMGYLLQDPTGVDYYEALATFKNCSLDQPYLCTNQSLIKNMQQPVFYSSAYLIIRCEALCYLPGYADGWSKIDSSITKTNMLSIDASLEIRDLDEKYNAKVDRLQSFLKAFNV